jgi:glycerate kinase
VKKIILGIGGSATTDLGIGMAAALGYRFLDQSDNELHPIGESLNRIFKIDSSHVNPTFHSVEILVACDVKNPLLGENGAAPVYGPQKGATPEIVKQLEEGLAHTADCIERDISVRVHDIPGGGAAGGLGAGLLAFCHASIHSGFELIAGITNLENQIQTADLIITGEGEISQSTIYGKVPHGVALMAKRYNVPVVALTGKMDHNIADLHREGITAVFPIQDGPLCLQDSINNAKELLTLTASQVIRLWQVKN